MGRGGHVEVVLLDKFMVPEESKAAFLAEIRKRSAFLRTLPGFVEGFVFESNRVRSADKRQSRIPGPNLTDPVTMSPGG